MKLPANASTTVSVTFTNANGMPAKVDGQVSWESSDPNIASVTADAADSTKAVVKAGPSAGEADIFATADADLGEGVKEVEAATNVLVIARGQAVGGEIHAVHPEHGLPGGGHVSGQPIPPGQVDNTLPGGPPGHVSGGPAPAPGHPSTQPLPGGGHVSGQPTPPQPGGPKPDQGLPPSAQPKK
jgi:hypothetical protein